MARPALFLCLALLSSCSAVSSNPDSGTDAGPPGVTPIELCDRLAAARCGLLERCYTAFAREDRASCVPLETARCLSEYETLRLSFEQKVVFVDGAKLSACETRMGTNSCPPTFPPEYPVAVARPFSDCGLTSGLITGKVLSGKTCERAVDCEPGTVCIKPGGVCKGTCSKWSQENEPCGFGCNPGLICDDKGTSDDADDRCGPPRTLNATCASSADCAAELVCSGTCRPRAKAGEACTFDSNRLSTCDSGLACDVTPYVMGAVGKCVAPQTEGGACLFHWSCAPGLVCADLDLSNFPAKAPMPGNCRKPAQPATNCPATAYAVYVGDQCGPGTVCSLDTRKCQAAPKQGEACTPSSQACVGIGIYCKPTGSGDVGTCTGPASTGERCAFEIDATRKVTVPCSSGYCETVNTLSCQPPSKTLNAECSEDGECVSGRCAVQQDRTLRCAAACNG
jgi:hypothetical protein